MLYLYCNQAIAFVTAMAKQAQKRHFQSNTKMTKKWCEEMVNSDDLNNGKIWIPQLLKFKFQMVWYSNGGSVG